MCVCVYYDVLWSKFNQKSFGFDESQAQLDYRDIFF